MPRAAQSRDLRNEPLNLRTTTALRTKIDNAVAASGRSRLQEIEQRLEDTFRQDELFGGPELRRVAYAMATAFALAGKYSAGPDVPAKDWLRDPTTCTTAVAGVVDVLIRTLPFDADALRLLNEAITGRLGSRWAQLHEERQK
jgi:hypothetical protein